MPNELSRILYISGKFAWYLHLAFFIHLRVVEIQYLNIYIDIYIYIYIYIYMIA